MSQQCRGTVSCSRSSNLDKMVSRYNGSRLEKLCHITIAAVQRYCDLFIMSSSEFKTVLCFNGSSVEEMCHVSVYQHLIVSPI
jgi:hypothetical protein